MKKLFIAALVLAGPSVANAYPQTVFDADNQCLSRQTSTGVRLVPPCNFSNTTYYADRNELFTGNQLIQNGAFKTNLQYRFQCESIRPLSIRYSLTADVSAQSTSRITGYPSVEKNQIELTHDFSQGNVMFDSLSGITGFQAIKPGCKLTVEQLVTYPEPRYFNQLASHLITLNSQFKTLYSMSAPSYNYVYLLGAIDNTLTALEMLQFDLEDEFLLDIVNESITQLTTGKQVLTQSCGSGSNSLMCTEEMAQIRSFADYQLQNNENNIRSLYQFVNEQARWVSSYDLARDKTMLNNTASKLRNQL